MAEAQPKAVYCTNLELPAGVHDFEASDTKTKAPDTDPIKRVIYMDDKVVPGSFYVEAVWVMGSIPRTHPEHSHPDHDEICGFVGSNMDDPSDLGAEIDFVVDGVKTTITKTCFIHIPAGVKHGGLCFRKIDRPGFHSRLDAMAEKIRELISRTKSEQRSHSLKCDRCGGKMRILCATHTREAIHKILDCLGIPSRPPPISPAALGRYPVEVIKRRSDNEREGAV